MAVEPQRGVARRREDQEAEASEAVAARRNLMETLDRPADDLPFGRYILIGAIGLLGLWVVMVVGL